MPHFLFIDHDIQCQIDFDHLAGEIKFYCTENLHVTHDGSASYY